MLGTIVSFINIISNLFHILCRDLRIIYGVFYCMLLRPERDQSWMKEHGICTKLSTHIRIQILERKNLFIKNYISRNVDPTTCYLKAFVSFVKTIVAQEDTLLRSKSKFLRIKGPKIWLASATKNSHVGIVRCGSKKFMDVCLILDHFGWGSIDEVGSCGKGMCA
jgi:hypothetical protein